MPKISYGRHLFIVVSTMQSKQQQRGFSVGDFIDRGILLCIPYVSRIKKTSARSTSNMKREVVKCWLFSFVKEIFTPVNVIFPAHYHTLRAALEIICIQLLLFNENMRDVYSPSIIQLSICNCQLFEYKFFQQ